MSDLLVQIGLSNLLVSGVLALIAFGVQRMGRAPAIAHLLWLVVLVKLVTPPIVTIPVFSMPAGIAGEELAMPGVALRGSAPIAASGSALEVGGGGAPQSSTSLWPAVGVGLLAVWAIGSGAILIVSLTRVVRFQRLLRHATKDTPALGLVAQDVAERLRLRSHPRVQTISARVSPMVWWAGGRVRVLVPETLLEELELRETRWILAHEFAHVRRRDYLVRWIEWLACVCFWWNPITWWARRNLRVNEEICCDAMVLASFSPKPQSYAGALMRVVEYIASPGIRPPAMASEITSGGLLERRFRMIVSKERFTRTPRWIQAGIAGLALAIMPLGVAAAQRVTDDPAVDALRDAVATGALTAEQAQVVYDASLFPTSEAYFRAEQEILKASTQIEKALESGRLTRDEADAKLAELDAKILETRQISFAMDVLGQTRGEAYLTMMRAKLSDLVASGELNEIEASQKLAEMEKAINLRAEFAAHMKKAEAEIRKAIEAGEITPAEGRKKLAAVKEGIGKRMRWHEANEEMKAKVASGEMTEEQAKVRLERMRKVIFGDQKTDIDWESIKRRIEGAVERGDMTREEAEAQYKRLLDRANGGGTAEGRDAVGDDRRGDQNTDRDSIWVGGTITAIERGGIVLAIERRDRQIHVRVTDRTRISRNGERAHLSDLHVGDHARVNGKIDRTRDRITIIAFEIAARGR